jgi:hypothetical protein
MEQPDHQQADRRPFRLQPPKCGQAGTGSD